ncbi:hypothetical protein ACIRU3_11735 [Streptomyces sp. NPDC101151]|uniref:hypothetical protein n=1 Tax=Streptomyces sp. NPDC101151 TaxID=3366115 RepID=UPI003806F73B
MVKHPDCPQPPGVPRWVAMFYQPSRAAWRVGAESPDRTPVLYAVGDMAQTVRARGQDVTVALWGPRDGAWQRFDTQAAEPAAPAAPEPSPERSGEPVRLAERMSDRRHQVLMAGLSKAGLYDLSSEDAEAVQALVDGLDEPTVRRVAHWLSAAGRPQSG